MQPKMENITKDYKPAKPAKALLIGHDPTLQTSETQADVTLFADYYFKYKDEEPKRRDEKSKFKLAQKSFEQIAYITLGKIKDDEIYITNLCNTILYKDKRDVGTVRIPESKAREGVERIREILKNNPTIKYVFPMSLQVNYWLQELGLYNSNDSFLIDTRPIKNDDDIRVFKPRKQKTFFSICGKRYKINGCGEQIVIPILHTKQFPLNKKTISYNDCYQSLRNYFENIDV